MLLLLCVQVAVAELQEDGCLRLTSATQLVAVAVCAQLLCVHLHHMLLLLWLQVAVAEPQEDGCLRVTSATQSLDAVQQAVCSVLGMPFNKVAVGATPATARQN
jgi:hypothetical protein